MRKWLKHLLLRLNTGKGSDRNTSDVIESTHSVLRLGRLRGIDAGPSPLTAEAPHDAHAQRSHLPWAHSSSVTKLFLAASKTSMA